MTYRQTLEYLYNQLPAFQRIGAPAYKADLSNTYALCELAGNPQRQLRTVHIAGTNGKGSVSHYLASVFAEAGYKTGLYTSPHLKDFRERIKINGKEISRQYVVRFVEKYKADFERIRPSFFEMTVLLAFCYFRDQKTDIAIIETGMGGRLDSTNVIVPEAAVITNVSLDHTQFLGNTLSQIAREKAGIIKPGIPVIIGEHSPETEIVFREKAAAEKAPLFFAQQNPLPHQYPSELKGNYQPRNIRTVLETVKHLREKGWSLHEKHIKAGIAQVVTRTGLRGRWETLLTRPLTICDIGHNEAGIREVVAQLAQTPHRQLHIVLGTVHDKDVKAMLSLLPPEAHYYFTQAQIPRALPVEELRELAMSIGLKGNTYTTVKKALHAATSAANEEDLIFIGGSAFVVAEAL